MAEVKHTPGPWRFGTFTVLCSKPSHAPGRHPGPRGDDPCVYDYTFNPDGNELFGADDAFIIEHDGSLSEANARLIAAAPDLLEAGAKLQAARKVQNGDPSAANALRVRRASDAFDAAIARARGEQDGGGE